MMMMMIKTAATMVINNNITKTILISLVLKKSDDQLWVTIKVKVNLCSIKNHAIKLNTLLN